MAKRNTPNHPWLEHPPFRARPAATPPLAVLHGVRCGGSGSSVWRCGVALTPGAKFCHECGAPVLALAAPERADGAPRGRARRWQPQPSQQPAVDSGRPRLRRAGGDLRRPAREQGDPGSAVPPMAAPTGAASRRHLLDDAAGARQPPVRPDHATLRGGEARQRRALRVVMAIPVYESLGPLDLEAAMTSDGSRRSADNSTSPRRRPTRSSSSPRPPARVSSSRGRCRSPGNAVRARSHRRLLDAGKPASCRVVASNTAPQGRTSTPSRPPEAGDRPTLP